MRWWPLRREAPPAPREPEQERPGLRLESEAVAPGETVRGSMVVAEGRDGGVQVAMRFHERSLECDVVVAEHTDPAPRREPVPAGVAYRFAIELPDDALPSCPTPHGGLHWTVDASGAAADAASLPLEVAHSEPEPEPMS